MRPIHSDPHPYHLIPAKPGDDATARRWNLVIIAILGMLVLGLFALALVPQSGSNASAAKQIPYKVDKDPAPQAARLMTHSSDAAVTTAPDKILSISTRASANRDLAAHHSLPTRSRNACPKQSPRHSV